MGNESLYSTEEAIIQPPLVEICMRLGKECNYVIDPDRHIVFISRRDTGHYEIMDFMGLCHDQTHDHKYKKGVFQLADTGMIKFAEYDIRRDYDDGTRLRQAIIQDFCLTPCFC